VIDVSILRLLLVAIIIGWLGHRERGSSMTTGGDWLYERTAWAGGLTGGVAGRRLNRATSGKYAGVPVQFWDSFRHKSEARERASGGKPQ
jgi:hypothetical protein